MGSVVIEMQPKAFAYVQRTLSRGTVSFGKVGVDRPERTECIAACFECVQIWTACADACLSEEKVANLTKCIRTDLDCADICAATGNVLSRHTCYDARITQALLEACLAACKTCADECEQHTQMHGPCKICAEACRRCQAACGQLAATLGRGASE